jgi:hypothetical protein
MGDLKLYARSPNVHNSKHVLICQRFQRHHLHGVFFFSKCAVFHAKNWKVQDPENGLDIMGDTVVQNLGVEDN